MNELAKLIIQDTQPIRALEKYLRETYEQVKDEKIIERPDYSNVDMEKIKTDPMSQIFNINFTREKMSAFEFIQQLEFAVQLFTTDVLEDEVNKNSN